MDIFAEIIRHVLPVSMWPVLPTRRVDPIESARNEINSEMVVTKKIFISGCDSGLGFEASLRLANQGF